MPKRTCKTCDLPLDRRNASGVCKKCRPVTGAATVKAPAPEGDGIVVNGDMARVRKTTTEHVQTLEDLIRVCQIDTTKWEITSWECKASQMMNVPRAVGKSREWARPSTDPVRSQLFHVSAVLRAPSQQIQTIRALRAGLLEDIARLKLPTPIRAAHRAPKDGYLFEFAPFDLHMGKLAWGEETYTDYDLSIASDLFRQSLEFHLERALRLTNGNIQQILFPFGNDVSHTDSKRAQTTAGTQMDVDTRYVKVYRRIVASHRWAIARLAEVAPVTAICIPGNHDELTSFHLGEVLAAVFEGDSKVTVDNGPKLRKYHDFGVNLFGFTNADAEKVSELPLLMAREQPKLWAQCESREWHIGHKHIKEKLEAKPAPLVQDLFSDKGVRVRRLTSLSAHDFWHTHHGYMDRRACEAFIYHYTAGYCGELSANVDHFQGNMLLPD
jgi:hypothetical protein